MIKSNGGDYIRSIIGPVTPTCPSPAYQCSFSNFIYSLPYGSKPDYGMDSYNKGGKLSVGPGVGGSGTRWQGSSSKSRAMSKKHESMLKAKHCKYKSLVTEP